MNCKTCGADLKQSTYIPIVVSGGRLKAYCMNCGCEMNVCFDPKGIMILVEG